MRQQTPSRLFSPHPILSIPQSICNQCHKCNNRILKSKPPPIDPPPRIGRNERYKITFSQEHATKSGCSQSKILSARVYLREERRNTADRRERRGWRSRNSRASERARSLFVPSDNDNDDGDAPHALVVAHLPRREEVRSRTIIDPRAFAFLSRPRPKKDPPTR